MGVDFSVGEAAAILRRLDSRSASRESSCRSRRPTIASTSAASRSRGQADLIEELARIHGYDRIPDSIIADEMAAPARQPGAGA